MKKFKVALQLFSIREDMEKNMDAALKTVKEIGYDYVEFAGFFEHSAEEVVDMLKKYDLKCISVHQDINSVLNQCQKAVDYLVKIGAKYCAIPWYSVEMLKGTPSWDQTVSIFTEAGKLLKKNNIQLMYHNHEFEFNKFEDKFLLDWIYDTIPSDILQPQIDTCWVHYAGCDPSEYIVKYSDRISIIHLKDFVCKNLESKPIYSMPEYNFKTATKQENGFELRPVGYGIQNFPNILEACEIAGVEFVVVEQDNSPDRPPMESAKMSREYLKSLGI